MSNIHQINLPKQQENKNNNKKTFQNECDLIATETNHQLRKENRNRLERKEQGNLLSPIHVSNTNNSKMNQYKYFVIILYVISACDIRINAQASVISNTNVHRLKRKRDPLNIKRGNLRFEAPKKSGDIFEINFGVLLPEEAIEIGCTYSEALPAIELAIKKLQQPGGLFEQYTISVDYRDTKSSSVHGTIAAFDLYTRQPQGFYLFIISFRFFVLVVDDNTER